MGPLGLEQDLTSAFAAVPCKTRYPGSWSGKMRRLWTILGVADVAASHRWYQELLGLPPSVPAHSYFGRILDGDGSVLLCLHAWGAHDHPPLGGPESATPGNGLLLFFRVEDFDLALQRARRLVGGLAEEPHQNPATGTMEFALRDPDGYYVMVSAAEAPELRGDDLMKPARDEIALLRHFLAALAYRTQKALREAPAGFAEFRAAPNLRTAHELVWHMTGVIGYAVALFDGTRWQPERLPSFEAEVARFHKTLEALAGRFDGGPWPQGIGAETLLQGPMADAMTHAGQLAMLRRIQGSPVPPENFLLADIRATNLGADQAMPKAPKIGWRPDQPPPSPGRPLV